jgi:hypothetical protein
MIPDPVTNSAGIFDDSFSHPVLIDDCGTVVSIMWSGEARTLFKPFFIDGGVLKKYGRVRENPA